MQLLQSHLICHLLFAFPQIPCCSLFAKYIVSRYILSGLDVHWIVSRYILSGFECALIGCLLQLMLNWLVGWLDGCRPRKCTFHEFEIRNKMVKATAADDKSSGVNTIKSPQSNPDLSNGQLKIHLLRREMILRPIFSEHYWEVYTSWDHKLWFTTPTQDPERIFHLIYMRYYRLKVTC